MTDRELEAIMVADALRYAARFRRERLETGDYKTPHSSRDNVGVHDGHKAGTYRRMPRTRYSNPDANEGTTPMMVVTLPDGSKHDVPAIPTWRKHIKTRDAIVHAQPESARLGRDNASEYD